MRNKLLLIAFSFLMAFVTAEIVLRVLGYTPWKPITEDTKVTFEPESPFMQDSVFGYKMKPGAFHIAQGEQSFITTQNRNGYRIVSATQPAAADDKRPRLNIMGDSFTFGSGVNDSSTYPWLMQAKLPAYRVENLSVPGYGVANVYTQMMNGLRVDSGDIVVYGYFAQHNNRYERRILKMMYSHTDLMGTVGYVLLDDNLKTRFTAYDYKLWYLSRYSALVNFIEDRYNIYSDTHKSHHAIAEKALVKMNDWCKSRGATFILLGVLNDDATKQMVQHCSQIGIRAIDISVDLNDKKYSQLPYDGHPNANANVVFANRLYNYLQEQGLLITDLKI